GQRGEAAHQHLSMRRRQPAARTHAGDGQEQVGEWATVPARAPDPTPGAARRTQPDRLYRPAFEPPGRGPDGPRQPRPPNRSRGPREDECRHAAGPKRYKGLNTPPGDL